MEGKEGSLSSSSKTEKLNDETVNFASPTFPKSVNELKSSAFFQ